MDKEIFYSAQEIADLLGVSASSILRWADSGKLKCLQTENGSRQFCADHLAEFAMTYNISMKFLDTMKLKAIGREEKKYKMVSAAR